MEWAAASTRAGFGPVSVVAVVLLGLLLIVAIWVARHPHLGQTTWVRLRDARLVHRVSDTAAVRGAWAWSSERLKDSDWASAHRLPAYKAGIILLVELTMVVSLAIGFTEVLDDVLKGDGISWVDRPVAKWLGTHRDPWLTSALLVITGVGSPTGLTIMAVLSSAAIALWLRSWLPVILALVAGIGILLVVLIAKLLVLRERPPIPYAVIVEKGFSFPSGHAAGSAAVVLLSAWLLTRYLITWWIPQVMLWTLAIGMIGAVGLSRIYLGVHYVSDVVGGWFLGAAWAAAVILVGRWLDRSRRSARQPDGIRV